MSNFSEQLHNIIPGGAHTYSRGDDQFPSNMPAIFSRGEGCYLFDTNNDKYLDYGLGLRSVNIGYGNREIANAAYEEILKGNNLTRASLTELKAAELLSELIPSAEMVKFAKHGSTVTTAAVKLARAYTGRKLIAVPKEHPFFSFDDWFIGSTALKRGIPEEIGNLTLQFEFNNIDSLKKLFENNPGQIACVITEPATTVSPCRECEKEKILDRSKCSHTGKTFLHEVKELCRQNGSVFILDEMITGFRWHLQGAQTYFDIEPDICTFGKAMANGFALAAMAGKREIMDIGNIREEGHERVFLTSTTHGAEMSALGAFIKTIEVIKRDNSIEHCWNYGRGLLNEINNIAAELGIQEHFYVEGFPCSPAYVTKDANKTVSLAMRTLFAQEMVQQKVIFSWIALCQSHGQNEFQITLEAVKNALIVYRKALEEGIEKYLKSPVIKPVFRKFN
jgi:glutamate-1-semialdehyde 2,1-aminomutase